MLPHTCVFSTGLLCNPRENLFSPPSHVVKEKKEAQSSEMSSPGSKTRIQFSCLPCFVSLLLGDGQTQGWEEGEEREEREEGKGKERRHILGELVELEESKTQCSLTPALETSRVKLEGKQSFPGHTAS